MAALPHGRDELGAVRRPVRSSWRGLFGGCPTGASNHDVARRPDPLRACMISSMLHSPHARLECGDVDGGRVMRVMVAADIVAARDLSWYRLRMICVCLDCACGSVRQSSVCFVS